MKKWTAEEENFIKDNWQKIKIDDMAEKLNRTKGSVSNKIQKIRASNGAIESYYKLCNYVSALESELELEGRRKTLELLKIKEKLRVNESLKIRIFASSKIGPDVLIGKIIQKTDDLIVIQTEHYKESFKYGDFYTGKSILVG